MTARPILALAAILIPALALADVSGPARVIDGDTIEIQGQRISLHGIDAPERSQTCLLQGRRYPCGVDATEALRELVDGKKVSCNAMGSDRYGRTVAICMIPGGIELGDNLIDGNDILGGGVRVNRTGRATQRLDMALMMPSLPISSLRARNL